MHLILIADSLFSVYAVDLADRDNSCMSLLTQKKDNRKEAVAVVSMLRGLERLAGKGSHPLCHKVCEEEAIWQLRADQYRILWFFDEGHVIICTHFFRKKSDKTPRREQERAIRIKEEYFAAKKTGILYKEW